MKKINALFCLLALLVLSCNKNDKKGMDFRVGGVTDLRIAGDSTILLPLVIEHISGPQEPLTISVTCLPAGITANASPASGTPPFSTMITFTAAYNLGSSVYPIKIRTVTQSGAVKELSSNITTVANCAAAIEGGYYGGAPGAADEDKYYLEVVKTGADKVHLQTYYGPLLSVDAELDCNSQTISIPSQRITVSGGASLTYSGTGTYDDKQIKITYKTVDNNSGTANTYTVVFDEWD